MQPELVSGFLQQGFELVVGSALARAQAVDVEFDIAVIALCDTTMLTQFD